MIDPEQQQRESATLAWQMDNTSRRLFYLNPTIDEMMAF